MNNLLLFFLCKCE